ncbi:MAG: RidA family protein [Acidobacteria bacterium]|nr:RidA family protein [Acidobacteriota bacterium]MBW4044547.1 RidA family protein [Acidobacteriota bacterium]
MNQTTRRNMLKTAAKAAAVGGAALAASGTAQAKTKEAPLEKKAYGLAPSDPNEAPLFSPAVSYGSLLFLSGVGAHFPGDVQAHTKHVLDELEKQLVNAGSSMDKVLKVNVYLNDIKDWPAMNEVYKGRFGKVPPVRTTVAPAGGIPGNSLVEIDLIAYI